MYLRRALRVGGGSNDDYKSGAGDGDGEIPVWPPALIALLIILGVLWKIYKWRQWQRDGHPGASFCEYIQAQQNDTAGRNQQSIEMAPTAAASAPPVVVAATVIGVGAPAPAVGGAPGSS